MGRGEEVQFCRSMAGGYNYTMLATVTQWLHLERDPESSCRQLSIKGRRIKARTLFSLYASIEDPMSPEEIAAAYQLPIDIIHEAIAYCESRPPEIHQDFLVEEALAEASGMNEPGYRLHGNPRPIPPEEYERIRERFRP
jgi:uncharacterized protein (DUF433 family)